MYFLFLSIAAIGVQVAMLNACLLGNNTLAEILHKLFPVSGKGMTPSCKPLTFSYTQVAAYYTQLTLLYNMFVNAYTHLIFSYKLPAALYKQVAAVYSWLTHLCNNVKVYYKSIAGVCTCLTTLNRLIADANVRLYQQQSLLFSPVSLNPI